jgi:hypothetical protein
MAVLARVLVAELNRPSFQLVEYLTCSASAATAAVGVVQLQPKGQVRAASAKRQQ